MDPALGVIEGIGMHDPVVMFNCLVRGTGELYQKFAFFDMVEVERQRD